MSSIYLDRGRLADVGLVQRQLESLFLTEADRSVTGYQHVMNAAHGNVIQHFANQKRAYSGVSPTELSTMLESMEVMPEEGKSLFAVLNQVGETILAHSVNVNHSTCFAHLHCPPLIPALAAETMISAANQSMDSWDQSPSATLIEQQMIRWLCRLYGYDDKGDGVFTSGGTQSNFMGLLLARDYYIYKRFNWRVQHLGLPPQLNKLRILCSSAAHFTVRQSAALLGLGEQAVITVDTDEHHRMCPAALDRQLDELFQQGLQPFAIVATVGTTDFGSVDPISELAKRAEAHGLWLHVDAAYGGALILSGLHRDKLAGIHAADSITVDFHKLFYQPISCGAFLLKERSNFDLMKLFADYLNPEDEEDGVPNLVSKSVQTTRRFDALKLYVSMQTLGRKKFADLIDYTIELAGRAARLIETDPSFELINEPTINAVVFRYVPEKMPTGSNSVYWEDRIHHAIRVNLLQRGAAVVARTRVAGLSCLKFTLLNPCITIEDVMNVLNEMKRIGSEFEREEWGRRI
jgi:L-2,4-diaminobutyrate decarboxylase